MNSKPPSGMLERLADVLLWAQLVLIIYCGMAGAGGMAMAFIDPAHSRLTEDERLYYFVFGSVAIPFGFALASAVASVPYVIKGRFNILPPQYRGAQITAIVAFPIFAFAMTVLFAIFAPDRI